MAWEFDSDDDEIYWDYSESDGDEDSNFSDLVLNIMGIPLRTHRDYDLESMSTESDEVNDGPIENNAEGDDRHGSQTLLETALKFVAKNFTSKDIDESPVVFDEQLWQKVVYWAFPQKESQILVFSKILHKWFEWDAANAIVKDEKVKNMTQVGFMATAFISTSTTDIKVVLTFEKQTIIKTSCSQCQHNDWCQHIIATILYRIKYPHLVPCYAPMTEMLSSLNRNQLQKIIQYAMNDDPAAIICRVGSYLGQSRDSKSDMSTIEGAPDPTYGSGTNEKEWGMVMTKMEEEIQNKVRTLWYTQYSFDSQAKSMFPIETFYAKNSFDLLRTGDKKYGFQIITHLLRCSIQDMPASKSRFIHDICHQVALYTHAAAPLTLQQWDVLKELHLLYYDEYKDLVPSTSQWAEYPSLTKALPKTLPLNQCGWLNEAFCARNLSPTPIALLDVVHDSTPFYASDYDEDIRVIIFRLQVLVYHRDITEAPPNLIKFLLLKLARMAAKHSILGAYLALLNQSSNKAVQLEKFLGKPSSKHTFENVIIENNPIVMDQHMDQVVIDESSNVCKELNITRKRKIESQCNERRALVRSSERLQKKPRRSYCAPVKSKTRKSSDMNPPNQSSDLSVGEIAFCMLSVCDHIFRSNDSVFRTLNDGYEPASIFRYCLLALEMSRFRLSNSQVTELEHECLSSLEKRVTSGVNGLSIDNEYDDKFFLEALDTVTLSFYGQCYPIVMLDSLLDAANIQANPGIVIKVCFQILMLFIDPVYQSSPTDNGKTVFSICTRALNLFFSGLRDKNETDIHLAIEYVKHAKNYKDLRLINEVCKNLKLSAMKFVHNIDFLNECFDFYIKTECHGKHYLDYMFLQSIASRIGCSCLRRFVGWWRGIISCHSMLELIECLLEKQKSQKLVPQAAVDLLLEILGCSVISSNCLQAVQVLRFFKSTDPNLRKCINMIMQNSRLYSASSLFLLARKESEVQAELCKPPWLVNCKNPQLMNDFTFKAIKVAFTKIHYDYHNIISRLNFSCIDIAWVCSCIINLPDKSTKLKYFNKLENLLVKSAQNEQIRYDVILHCIEQFIHDKCLTKWLGRLFSSAYVSLTTIFTSVPLTFYEEHECVILINLQDACSTYQKLKPGSQKKIKRDILDVLSRKLRSNKKLHQRLNNTIRILQKL